MDDASKPYLIDELFAKIFGATIGSIFYKIDLDHWRPLSKVAVFVSAFLVPIAIGVYEAIRGLSMSDKDKKAKEENKDKNSA